MIRFSKTHTLALVAAVGLCSALITTAQPPEGERRRGGGDRAARILERFDENGDGKLEPGEVSEEMWQRLVRRDANQDGAVTADELNGAGSDEGRRRGRRGGNPVLQALDTDKDGKLSAAEIAAASQALLTLDKNGDGELTPDELRSQRRGGMRGEGRDRPAPPKDGPRGGEREL